jgi:hypothetical protein
MVIPSLTTLISRRNSYQGSPERQNYEVIKAIDPGVTWKHLDHEIEGLGRLPL